MATSWALAERPQRSEGRTYVRIILGPSQVGLYFVGPLAILALNLRVRVEAHPSTTPGGQPWQLAPHQPIRLRRLNESWRICSSCSRRGTATASQWTR